MRPVRVRQPSIICCSKVPCRHITLSVDASRLPPNIYSCRYQRRLLEANADGSQLAALDDTGTMSVYALNRGQASSAQLDFQAEGVTSVVWNTDHPEVHLFWHTSTVLSHA